VDTENGITYIMGNAGLKYYSSADDTYYDKLLFNTTSYQIFKLTGNRLEMKTCGRDGSVLDTWSKTSKVADLIGDVNKDFKVDEADIDIVKAAVLAGGAYDEELDVNNDDRVDIRDAQYIVRIITGK
jgi:hypothetical protein